MPKFNCILNLPGFSVLKVSGYQPLLFDVAYTRKPRCGHCDGRQVRIKDSFIRTVKHEAIAERCILLRFKAYKLFCHQCQRYSNQRFPGIQKHQRSTQRLHKQIFHLHTDGLSQKTLAKQFKVGKATVERWYHQQYELARKKIDVPHCPTVLGIDEHSFSKKQGFATTLCDLRKHKIYDVVPGKSEPDLNQYTNQLQGKDKVRVICMDLSSTYRNIAKTHFPNAKIVADRFHVIRLMHHHCMQTYRAIDQSIKHNRGILAVLRKKPDRLTDKQRQRRENTLKNIPRLNTYTSSSKNSIGY